MSPRGVYSVLSVVALGIWPSWSGDKTELHLEVVSLLGEPIDAELELVDLTSTARRVTHYRSNQRIFVPPSTYLIRVAARGFAKREHVLDVSDRKVYLRIGMNAARLGDWPPKRRTIGGRVVIDGPQLARAWVKLVPILNNQQGLEMPLGADGGFSFSGVETGEYVLLVVRGDRLLDARQVSCCPNGRVQLLVKIVDQK